MGPDHVGSHGLGREPDTSLHVVRVCLHALEINSSRCATSSQCTAVHEVELREVHAICLGCEAGT